MSMGLKRSRSLMKLYLLKSDHRYQGFVLEEDPKILDVLLRFDGTRIGKSWSPLRVEVDDDDPSQLPLADFPSLTISHIPCFSKFAVATLHDVLVQNGEVLPLSCDAGDYFAYNVTSIIDALNIEASDIDYFPSGKFMDVKRYTLYPERVKGADIFKLPQAPLMGVFVTDRFVRLVEQNQLSGFLFKPL